MKSIYLELSSLTATLSVLNLSKAENLLGVVFIYRLVNTAISGLLLVLVEDLKEKLDSYISQAFGNSVKLIRNSDREGLIRSRMIGARAAISKVSKLSYVVILSFATKLC